jgi:hypothetical protein
MRTVGLEAENMRTVLFVMAIAAAQASLGCATESRSKYLAARDRYEDCVRASTDGQKCRLLREEAEQAARRYEEDALLPRMVEDFLNEEYRNPVGRE